MCDCIQVLEAGAKQWREHGAALVAGLPSQASRSQAENGNRKAAGLTYAANVLRAHQKETADDRT